MTTPERATPNRAGRRRPDKAYSPARRRYCSIGEAADYLGVTERTVRQMISDGRLVGYRMGNRFIRLDLDEIDDAMVPFGGDVQ
ncbi:excisionase family DNA-binding protein [Mycolicibacterium novocastrense]|nr:excisionase family DNA-binding protein [Mycolicibacterium novocastrense]